MLEESTGHLSGEQIVGDVPHSIEKTGTKN
jgi:hypothetical protein